MSSFVQRVLNQQRKRVIGQIMSHLESQVYPSLNEAQQHALRNKVIAAITQYHDTTLDLVKASVDDGTQVNQEAINLLMQISAKLPPRDG